MLKLISRSHIFDSDHDSFMKLAILQILWCKGPINPCKLHAVTINIFTICQIVQDFLHEAKCIKWCISIFCIDFRRQHKHAALMISGKNLIMMTSCWHHLLAFLSIFPLFWDLFPALCVLIQFSILHLCQMILPRLVAYVSENNIFKK